MARPNAPTITDPDLTQVRAAYAFADDREVTEFLREHPFLIPLLEAARGPLAEHFGAETPVRLEVRLDPVSEEDRALIAVADATRLSPDEAVARLGAFWNQWQPDDPPRWWKYLRFDIV